MNDRHDRKKAGHEYEPAPPASQEIVKPGAYLRAVKAHLRKGNQKAAFSLLQRASIQYPEDPVILSYYGCFQAIVDRKYRAGVENCKKALSLLKKESSFGEETLYPVFFLNLGRAYIAAGKKKEALVELTRGLKYDNRNSEILQELRTLGMRKKAPVPFLDRSNPINKYIGLILHTTKKRPDRSK
jgi:tetratricopeptide (TPR) repeat protein